MNEEEKQPEGNNSSTEERHIHDHTEVVDDARSRALAEALQSSFKVVRVFLYITLRGLYTNIIKQQ